MKIEIKNMTLFDKTNGEKLFEQVVCADCGKIINKKDADYSLGDDRPICQNCFEAREHNSAWW